MIKITVIENDDIESTIKVFAQVTVIHSDVKLFKARLSDLVDEFSI